MKKAIILLVCWAVAFGGKGMEADFMPLAAIDGGWKSERIQVDDNNEPANLMTLLKAFHTAWPTEAVQSLIDEAGDRLFVSNDVTDCDDCSGHTYLDLEDFNCASYDDGMVGTQRIEARTYERENGHTLFAICLEESGVGQMPFCCFYDYDTATRTMTPEEVPYVGLKRKWSDSRINYYLGFEYDLTLIVHETSPNGEDWFHHYYYNGMRHVYHHSGENSYTLDNDEDEMDDMGWPQE